MFGNGAYLEVYAPSTAPSAPMDLIHGLSDALAVIGNREWWHLRFWSTDESAAAVAMYIAINADPNEASDFVARCFADYMNSNIGRNSGAKWTVGDLQPLPEINWSGPDPESGHVAIRYFPGLSLYSSGYVPETEVVDIFGDDLRVQLGFQQSPLHWTPGGKGGGLPEPATIEVIIGAVGAVLTSFVLGGIVPAAGADTWAALKRAVGRLRKHPSNVIASAELRVAIRFSDRQWIAIRAIDGRLDTESLTRLEGVEMPEPPRGGFEIVAEWDPESRKWKVWLGESYSEG